MSCYHRLISDIETYCGNIMFQKLEKNSQTKINKDVKAVVAAYRILFPEQFPSEDEPYITVKLNSTNDIQLVISDALMPYYINRSNT